MKSMPFARLVSAAALLLSASIAAPAHAGPYTGLVVFGDSVSDIGNVALAVGAPNGVPQTVLDNSYIPSAPYTPSGTFSNGPIWVTSFASRLGLSITPSLALGTDFAFGGARVAVDGLVPSLSTQVSGFLSAAGPSISSGSLYVVAGVGNDARDGLKSILTAPNPAAAAAAFNSTVSDYARDMGNIVDRLQGAGATHILVVDTVNLGLTPAVRATDLLYPGAAGYASLLSYSMDAALTARLSTETGVKLFDAYSFLTGVVANPAAAGFANVTDACGAIAGADCSLYAFWDGIHPTTAFHQVLAGALFAAAVPEPSAFALFAIGLLGVALAKRRRAS